MTSRELLALAAIGAPAVTALALAVVPRRLVDAAAKIGAVLSALAAGALATVALTAPGSPLVERWLVVDAAAGLADRGDRLGRARKRLRIHGLPFIDDRLAASSGASVAGLLRTAVRVLGNPRRRSVDREPRGSLAARRSDDRSFGPARWIQRPAGRARGGLEVPDPHLARPRLRSPRHRRAGRAVDRRRARRALLARALDRAARSRNPGRLPAPPRRARLEDRVGARAQLASGRTLRGARPRLGAPLRGPPPDGAARRLAFQPGAHAGARRVDHARGAGRLRSALAGGRRSVPLALLAVEAAARLLEPRAHGRDRPRDRLRQPRSRSPASRCTSPATQLRRRPASTPRRRCSHSIRAGAYEQATECSEPRPGSDRCSEAHSRPSQDFPPRRSSSARF